MEHHKERWTPNWFDGAGLGAIVGFLCPLSVFLALNLSEGYSLANSLEHTLGSNPQPFILAGIAVAIGGAIGSLKGWVGVALGVFVAMGIALAGFALWILALVLTM